MNSKQVIRVLGLAVLLAMAVACTPAADNATGGVESMATLEEARWVLESYADESGVMAPALADREVTAEFGADGQLGGNAGCNSYFATYSVDGDQLTITDAGSTLMACDPPEVMAQETQFMADLAAAAGYNIADGRLTITNAAGKTILNFVAGESASLTGTTWTAQSVSSGDEAVVSTQSDSTITAVFTEDGKLNGTTGCNDYMTSYTLESEAITIETPAATRKMCNEPAGVMEQEAQYLSALPAAATYQISGDQLELHAADGSLVAFFIAQRGE